MNRVVMVPALKESPSAATGPINPVLTATMDSEGIASGLFAFSSSIASVVPRIRPPAVALVLNSSR